MYISWAAYYEGRTDAAYFNVLIPRILDEILRRFGVRPFDVALAPSVEFGLSRRSVDEASADICERRNEFHLLFVHADAGGRNQREGIAARREAIVNAAEQRCQFNPNLVVYLTPVRELEAWALADLNAVQIALGVTRLPEGILAPQNAREAERLEDPKRVLEEITRQVTRRGGNGSSILVRIAQEQSLDQLRRSPSFLRMEEQIVGVLENCRFIVRN